MRHILLLLTLVTNTVVAQQHYVFSTSNESYNDLQNPIQIAPANFGSGDMTFLTLDGETFNFFGVDFPFGGIKTFVIQTNGNIRIDNDSSMVIVDGAFTWLDSVDASSSLSYTIEGSNGNKIVKAQWKNLEVRNGVDGNFMNLQIWVHQSSGIIELRYGPRSDNNASGYTISNGPNVGMFFALDDFSQMFEKLWLNGSPDNTTLDSNSNLQFQALSGLPTENTVYRFTPNNYTSIEMLPNSESPFKLYPNTTDGTLQLKDNPQFMDITISDALGRIVQITGDNQSIDLSDLSPGIYSLAIRSRQGIFVHKVIKR